MDHRFYESLWGDWLIDSKINVYERARDLNPRAHICLAVGIGLLLSLSRIASRLGVPLIASFNDWYDYGGFLAHNLYRASIESRFLRFYGESDLALCTSEGMRRALGTHRNAHVLYPTGAPMIGYDGYEPVKPKQGNRFTVFFGGSLGDWYGTMMEALVKVCTQRFPEVQFEIFGALQSWSPEFDRWATDQGVFRGRVGFDELRNNAAKADLLILPMGFGLKCAHVERNQL